MRNYGLLYLHVVLFFFFSAIWVSASTVPALVQANAGQSFTSTNTVSFSGATTAGNAVVVLTDHNVGLFVTSVSDTAGNKYQKVASQSFQLGVELWVAFNIQGGPDTVTVQLSGTPTTHETYIHEYSGIIAVDGVISGIGSGTSVSIGPLTTTSANDLIFGGFIWGIGEAPGAGFTARSTFKMNLTEDEIASTVGSYQVSGTQFDSYSWVGLGVAFKAGSSTPAASVAVSISPSSAWLTTGSTQQFTATVSGTTNTAVTWTATGGTVSTSGFYTAPASAGTYMLTATSVADPSKSASAAVTVVATPPSSVPMFVQVKAGVCASATACAQDLTSTAGNSLLVYVQWQTGAPPPSVTDTQGNAYQLAVAQSGSWSNALLYAQNVKGGANTVTANFGSNQTIELWVHEYANLGDLDGIAQATGSSAAMSLGPLAVSQPGELLWAGFMDGKMGTATAGFTTRSTLDGNLTEDAIAVAASSTIIAATQLVAHPWVAVAASFKPASVGPPPPPAPVMVTISPASATVALGGTQQFTATVTGSTNTAVTWSAAGGSVSTGGLYTAPSTAGAYTVKATSVADNSKSASATVIVAAPVQHTVTLNWKASTSAVSGYNVYRGAVSHGPYTQINTVLNAPTNYVDNTVESGQTYYYVVTSVESGVESVYSNEVVATIPTP